MHAFTRCSKHSWESLCVAWRRGSDVELHGESFCLRAVLVLQGLATHLRFALRRQAGSAGVSAFLLLHLPIAAIMTKDEVADATPEACDSNPLRPRAAMRQAMAAVFGDDFENESEDDGDVPTRPARRTTAGGDSDSENDEDEILPAAPAAKIVAPKAIASAGAGSMQTTGHLKGRLSKLAVEEDNDDDDDDVVNDSGDEEERPMKRREKSSRLRKDDKPSWPRRKGALDDIEDDDFIDDSKARRYREDDDDVVRTEGGWDVDVDDIEARPGEEDEEPEKPMTEFERAEARVRANRRKRRKEADPSDIDEKVVEFLSRMMQAREDDVEAYNTGKPALNKLRMLPEVKLMFVKHDYREALLDRMVLAVLKCWLEPMHDMALPNIEIRTELLNILTKFRVDSSWVDRLESSQGLGKLVNFLSYSDDHLPNQAVAKKLIRAWTRPFYARNDDFHDLLGDYEQADGISQKRVDARKNLAKLEARNQKRLDILHSQVGGDKGAKRVKIMATVPEKTPYLFSKLTKTNRDDDDPEAQRATKNVGSRRKSAGGSSAMAKRFNSLKKARQSGTGRAVNPSINGR
jgi:hypothetical protein